MIRCCTILAVAFAFSACVNGIEPPKPTTLVKVAGGEFLFGSTEPCFNKSESVTTCKLDNPGMKPTDPAVKVTLQPFAIEEHEVTNFQYEYCVARGVCKDLDAYNVQGIDSYFLNPAYRSFPVANVNVEMAAAYCRFVGRRLPTEVEWERAAAGPALTLADKRVYPIDDGETPIASCGSGKIVAMKTCTGIIQPSAVKSSIDDVVYEAGAPIYDLAGNMAELVDGAYVPDVTCKTALPPQCQDCFTCTSTDCKSSCYLDCKACDDDATCFNQCKTESFPGIPRCFSYGDAAQDPKVLYVPVGDKRLARGGSYVDGDNQSCRASTTDRGRYFIQSQAQVMVGFRCAVDQ